MPRARWNEQMLLRLVYLREELKLKWDVIGGQFDVRASLVCTKYHDYKSRLRIAAKREEMGLPAEAPKAPAGRSRRAVLSEPAAPPVQPVKRPRYFHDQDNDLRARIARQGLTAGFLGDPPPGRSALDQRGAGK